MPAYFSLAETIRFSRRRLPHWEVRGASYFVTVRCADSLPRAALLRMQEIQENIARVPTHDPAFAAFQRQLFVTLEKYLDAGHGACPLRNPDAAATIVSAFAELEQWNVAVPSFTIMPNHWHAYLEPAQAGTKGLHEIMKRLKGRTGLAIRKIAGGRGPLWQSEWFDRWIRDEAERDRVIDYIQQNPVKAGLVKRWQDHPYTR